MDMCLLKMVEISIHAPRVGSDYSFHSRLQFFDGFLSTLPAWGATTGLSTT